MPISTTNEKLAVIELEDIFEPAIPMIPTIPFDQADKQQLIWGYPGILWAASVTSNVTQSMFKAMFRGMFKGMNG